MNGKSMMVVTLPGANENTQTVMPMTAAAISAISAAGADGADIFGARHRRNQLNTTGATHNEPSQFPAHHNCHSRRYLAPPKTCAEP